MHQLATGITADLNCTHQVPIKRSLCFGHRQSGLVAERSIGVASLQLLKPLVRSLEEIITTRISSYKTAMVTTLVASYYSIGFFEDNAYTLFVRLNPF